MDDHRRMVVLGWHERSFTLIIYLYDGNDLLAEMDASGNILARYTQGGGIEEPLAQFCSGSASYYETDVLGSVTSTTTPASAIANSYSYDSFGNTVTSTSPTMNSIRYAARELDPETGIYNDRARYYDPSSGRFVSEDPVGFEAGETHFYRLHRSHRKHHCLLARKRSRQHCLLWSSFGLFTRRS